MKNKVNVNAIDEQTKPKSRRGRKKEERETKKNYTVTLLPSVKSNAEKIANIKNSNLSASLGDLLEDFIKKNRKLLEEEII